MSTDKIRPPPKTTNRWVRLVVGFGVAVSLGMAPFLGLADVPGFTALLALFPELPWNTRTSVVPLSSFVMGVVAVLVQFLSGGTIAIRNLRRLFYGTLAVVAGAFLALFVVHTFVVEYVSVPAAAADISVLTGFSRPVSCRDCSADMSDAECLGILTLSPARIRSCWGDGAIQSAFLFLALPYFTITSSFGVLVGCLMLRKR